MSRDFRYGLLAAICVSALAATSVTATAWAGAPGAGCGDRHWVSTWSASPTDAVESTGPETPGGEQTYRVVVTPHRGGDSVRIRLTNRFGSEPVTFTRVTVGRQTQGAALDPDSVRPVTFAGGSTSTTVAPGADVASDPVPITVEGFEPLSISIHTDGRSGQVTGHASGNATSYYTPPGLGDHTADLAGDAFSQTTTRVPFVSQVDMLAPAGVTTVVAFGDSATDGHVGADFFGTQQVAGVVDQNVRYPDFLQRRLDEAGSDVVVTNAGIGGNRLLSDGLVPALGRAGESRIEADVLTQPGVTDVIVWIGMNDLGMPIGAPYEQLVTGYTRVIDRLHDAGLRVHLGTMMPASNGLADGLTSFPPADPVRVRVNSWIRSQRLSDSVIDFDAAVRDPNNPSILERRYASADNLHPTPDGYRLIADTVDITEFTGNECTAVNGSDN
ncbi:MULTISPECIES: GDSL-type esterase/lipase family protein [unclassified Rhodococcus (in: high G+C Gram-positive bacteria)]|uniref:GDSL-type esterase/lipase family protein n=1 Tax=unclassified Rhodococcus (in: high G+C Gram-positive bacteria) TaxID=192944 RepID=UPI000BCB2B49|nr:MULTISPECIES: GDSL-type esterase/lipase family protein [unclassified Rhodococcus (in: high G+C Gram-positive bacteria)]MBP1161104.1 lysophospholipase L1-like esterase [Rhodococcus sp. PvR099]PTR39498.1 lysophospholipase L1-like esterase [Rhodococcus sp. OK611]SNX92649.1 Lysophospholipase L1 [Rhodococcus sp. OK270]